MKKQKKVRKLFSLNEATVRMIEEMAEKERRKLSAIIDLAIEKVYKTKKDNTTLLD